MSNEPGKIAKSSTYGADADKVAVEVIKQAKFGSVNEPGIIEWCRQLAVEHGVTRAVFVEKVAKHLPRHTQGATLERIRPLVQFLGL